jgi:hypothetical protein
MPRDPAIVDPPAGKFTKKEMARWPQYAGVRRVPLTSVEHEDQFMLVRSLHEVDARNHFAQHGFKFQGSLAFNVPFDRAPPWLIRLAMVEPIHPKAMPVILTTRKSAMTLTT